MLLPVCRYELFAHILREMHGAEHTFFSCGGDMTADLRRAKLPALSPWEGIVALVRSPALCASFVVLLR